jgi:hypothetical protein
VVADKGKECDRVVGCLKADRGAGGLSLVKVEFVVSAQLFQFLGKFGEGERSELLGEVQVASEQRHEGSLHRGHGAQSSDVAGGRGHQCEGFAQGAGGFGSVPIFQSGVGAQHLGFDGGMHRDRNRINLLGNCFFARRTVDGQNADRRCLLISSRQLSSCSLSVLLPLFGQTGDRKIVIPSTARQIQ